MTPLVLLPFLLAASPFDEALVTVPPTANVLVLVDVKKVLASPVAGGEDMAGQVKDRYRSGSGLLPPGAERVVVAGQAAFAEQKWDWMAATIDAPDAPDVQTLLRRENGQLSTVAERPVVLSPRGAYFTTLNPNRLVAFYPADRQALSRWIRHAKAAKTPDFHDAAVAAAAENQVVIGVDLTDSLDPNFLKATIPAMVSLSNAKFDPVAFSRAMASARRLVVTMKLDTKITATVRVDFSDAVGAYRDVLKAVFIEMLEGQGAALPELSAMAVTFPDKGMVLTGELSPASFARVMGIFALPHASPEPSPGETDAPTATATKRYYDAVKAIVADVAKLKVNKQYDKTAAWHESAARKLEQLNPRGVDPDALKLAGDVANRFRAIAGSLRGVPIDMTKLQNSSYYMSHVTGIGGGGGWGNAFTHGRAAGWGGMPFVGMNVDTNIPQIQAQAAKVIADDEKLRTQLWGQIDEGLSKTRATLATKYPGI